MNLKIAVSVLFKTALLLIKKKEGIKMKEAMNVKGAPAAVGPYVHAVKSNGLIFLSGQLGLNPQDGTLPEGIEAQTKQSLENIKTVLEGCGSDLNHVIKTSIFLDSMDDFGKVNEIYAKYFSEAVPARSCVEVAKLPKGGLVEIEAIAEVKEPSHSEKEEKKENGGTL